MAGQGRIGGGSVTSELLEPLVRGPHRLHLGCVGLSSHFEERLCSIPRPIDHGPEALYGDRLGLEALPALGCLRSCLDVPRKAPLDLGEPILQRAATLSQLSHPYLKALAEHHDLRSVGLERRPSLLRP